MSENSRVKYLLSDLTFFTFRFIIWVIKKVFWPGRSLMSRTQCGNVEKITQILRKIHKKELIWFQCWRKRPMLDLCMKLMATLVLSILLANFLNLQLGKKIKHFSTAKLPKSLIFSTMKVWILSFWQNGKTRIWIVLKARISKLFVKVVDEFGHCYYKLISQYKNFVKSFFIKRVLEENEEKFVE